MSKAELRTQMATLLRQLPVEEITRQSAAVTKAVVDSEWFKLAKRLSVYVSMPTGEINTDAIITHALASGKEVFIPRTAKKNPRMSMLRLPSVEAFAGLPVGLWGIRQPTADADWDDYSTSGPLDLVLAPGVAFTRSGDRLGHGKGYYDKFLQEHRQIFGKPPGKVVGIALELQIVDFVPTDSTDVTLDSVVTA